MAMAMAARRGGWHSASLHYSALATGFYRAVPPPLYDLFPCANMSRLLAPHKLQRHLYSSAYPSSLSHDDPARHSSPVHVANTPPTDKSVTTTTATAATAATASDARERARAAIIAREQASPMAAAAAAASSPHLRDRHARQHTYLRISLTERCNLRCLYCMPLEGVPLTPNESLLTAPEVERLARLFVSQGVTKIRLTGGEPTIRKDLPDVISGLAALRSMGLKQIGITTNGLTIPRHINHLVASGLTHLNVSLDTLDPFKFELMTRRPAKGIHKVLSGIETALALGVPQVKINVVVVRGLNDGQDVLDFVEWVKHRKVIVRFIEYMPFDGNRWRPEKLVPYNDLLGKITSHFGPLEKVGDDPNDTSKHWRVPGHQGSIGFITSMTDHFCGTCNRLRITADGNLKVCLFGNSEVSLRDAMRHGLHGSESPASNNELLHIVGAAVKRKHARHAGMADPVELAKGKNRAMIQIGG